MTMYPWGGNFKLGNPDSCVAVVTMAEKVNLDPEKVAIWGPLKTENLGIEKIIANLISNPNIRFMIVFGREIQGHRSGGSLLELFKSGLDENNRIKGAPGAVPYIENLGREAVVRFIDQITPINLLGVTDKNILESSIDDCLAKNPGSYGEPYIAIRIEQTTEAHKLSGDIALHSAINMDLYGRMKKTVV